MLERIEWSHQVTLGADKGYDSQDFIKEIEHLATTPHVARNATAHRRSFVPDEVAAQPGYAVSIRCGQRPEVILADAGYRSEQGFQELEDKGFSAVVALGRESMETESVDQDKLPCTRRMQERMASQAGRETYRQRKWIVEPVFGWIKNVLGFRQMSMRGMTKARAEWSILCTAMNLKRMHTLKTA